MVELCFFGRLGVEETGRMLEVAPETVLPDWRLAKSWLLHELDGLFQREARALARLKHPSQ
jgi:hypothetical protein